MVSKHRNTFFILLFASVFIMIPSVSAYYFGNMEFVVRDVIETAREIISPILEVIIGDYSTGEFFFVKVLLLILLFIIIQYAMKKMPSLGEQNAVVNIVSAVVSILAVRFLRDNDLINGILLPYSTLGIVVTTLVPAVIFFYILNKGGFETIGRRLGWIFFGVIFAVLWYSRFDELSPIGNQIYLWLLIATLLCIIFDKNINYYFGYNADLKHRKDIFTAHIARIDEELGRLYAAPQPTPAIESRIASLEEQRTRLKKGKRKFF